MVVMILDTAANGAGLGRVAHAPILLPDSLPVLHEPVPDLFKVALPDQEPELFWFELVLLVEFRDSLDLRPADRIEGANGESEICDLHVLSPHHPALE